MPFNINTQAIIAFKHLLGKSQTDVNKGVNNEFEGLGLTVMGQNVWTEVIDPSPAQGVIDGVAVAVSCDTILDATSNGHALFAMWPVTAPTGTDPVTGLAFAYGSGSLVNVTPGDRVRGSIPDSFGVGYLAKPFFGGSPIAVGDQRDWVYQYDSGIFFQEDGSNESWGGSPYGHPDQIDLYVYIGDTVLDITGGGGGGSSEWYASVSSIISDPPVSPTTGDRYLIAPGPSPAATGAWIGKESQIAEWSGFFWLFAEPTQGGTVQVDAEPGVYYLYSGADYPGGNWVQVPTTIVRIGTATGTDTYTGTVDPPIVSYDNVVFIGVFDNANTGASTIDINSLGTVSIKKSYGTSLIELEPNDIRSGIMYMLVYDGSVFQLYTGDLGTPLQEVLTKGSTYLGPASTSITSTTGDFNFNALAGDFDVSAPAGRIYLETYPGPGGSTYEQNSAGINLNFASGFSEAGAINLADAVLLTSTGSGISAVLNVGYNGISITRDNQSIVIDGAITITDSINSKGAVYPGDYTANFTEHSLVTKGYVDMQLSVENLWDLVGGDLVTSTANSPDIPNVLPRFNGMQDLGSLSKRWNDLYLANNIYIGTNGRIYDDAGTLKIGNNTGNISFADAGNILIPQAGVSMGFGTTADSTHKMRITIDGSAHTIASRVDLSGSTGSMTGYNVRSTGAKTGAGTLRGVDVNVTGTDNGSYTYIGGRFRAIGATNLYSLELIDGTEGVGKVLTSVTAGGLANWADPNTLITPTLQTVLSNGNKAVGNNIILDPATAATDGVANSSPLFYLRGNYDSDPTAGVTSTNIDTTFQNKVTLPFGNLTSQFVINHDGDDVYSITKTASLVDHTFTAALGSNLSYFRFNNDQIFDFVGLNATTGSSLTFNLSLGEAQIKWSGDSSNFLTLTKAVTNTADRTQTFQDKDGTIALTSDVPGTYKESFLPGTVGVANTITHNLGTEDLQVQLWHNKKLITADTVEIIDANTVEVTFVGTNPSEVSPALVKITIATI